MRKTVMRMLRDGLRKTPDAASLHHTLGLTLARLERNLKALTELQRAVELAPANTRFAYVYAVALHAAGNTQAALVEIDRALAHQADDRDLLVAAATFRLKSGDIEGARRYARHLSRRYPEDPTAAQLTRKLDATH